MTKTGIFVLRFTLRVVFLCAFLLSGLSFALQARADEPYYGTVWAVKPGSSVYIRLSPETFFLGTLHASEHFKLQRTYGAYRFGRCGGQAQRCGWVVGGPDYWEAGGSISAWCSGSGSTSSGITLRRELLSTEAYCVNDYVYGVFFADQNDQNSQGTYLQMKPGMVSH